MKKKALVAMAALALMLSSVSAFAAAGTCQDWRGVWEFTYDNTTSTAKTFCFDNSSKYKTDNVSLVVCVDNATGRDNCTCIADNASKTQLWIDNTTKLGCDNATDASCKKLINPLYKKATVTGKKEVIITDILENAAAVAGPIGNTCLATGKRGTQDITITAPDNITLNNASYIKYYPHVANGTYVVQEGSGQALMSKPQTRVLKAKFLSDNFTAEQYWNIQGLKSGKFVRELTCDDLDNCTEEKACELKIAPKKISKLLSFLNPISPFVISAAKDSDTEFARPIKIDFNTDAIKAPIAIKIGTRIIFGLMFKRPLKLESDNYTVDVTYGDNGTACATIEVK